MLGKGQSGGYPPESSGELMQSLNVGPVDGTSKKGFPISGQLPGNVPTTAPQQSQSLLLTPASLQLAQLQAQLTLQRLKLSQGGNPTSAAVLNQVLSNVAMSQPLFNHLRTSAMVGNPQSTFTSGVLGFPSTSSTLSALAGGVFNQNSSMVRPNQPIRGATIAQQQNMEYSKKSGSAYPSDTDRRAQYNLIGTSGSETTVDRQYSLINTQAKNLNSGAFQRDMYGQDMQGQQAGFSPNDQSAYNSTVKNDQWKASVHASYTGTCEVSKAGPLWTAAGQTLRSRSDLYNPEEPTSDPKFNSGGMQGFGGYQTLHSSEELRILQPHQVNDYYAVTPSQLPHQCSICDKKVYNLKDWEQHVKGKLHLQNKTLYSTEGSAVVSSGAVHYAVGRPSDGALNTGSNSMVFTTAGQDVSSGGCTSYLPAAAMKTYPISDTGFTSLQIDSKSFPPRKATAGRVVHICNLPEGSCTENDVINLGLPFGKVTNYILMRSTHQAFVEMAYVEAAQAMVQYYQLTPAMINNQKLLIRMSKRYKELQLKKPGKDVDTIIHDITSQRERDEIQEPDHYIPERARSRSPISRSLSPHIHSPGFTCDAPQSPQATLCRGAERGTNGLVPHRNSWDWPSHSRRGEDDREDPWRNGASVEEDRPNGWGSDWRKTYQKLPDHMNLRSADERGSGRDWHPQRMSYRSMEDNYYTKEQMYNSDKPPRPPYHRHETKSKRRDNDYHRSRHEFDMTVESRAEDKRSPERGRSKKTSRKHSSADKHNKENTTEESDRHSKEKSTTPPKSSQPKESDASEKRDEREVEKGEDSDEECWYPKNMEELVTVDEVGGEDDIVEPDLPELEECVVGPRGPVEKENLTAVSDMQQTQNKTSVEAEPETPSAEDLENNRSAECPEEPKHETSINNDLNKFSCEDFKVALEETCPESNKIKNGILQKQMDIITEVEDKSQDTEAVINGTQYPQDIEVLLPSCEKDKAVSEHSIPLGVEFIVPQSGFYCKLCGLFYTNEETAKATHCRSMVHYRNLQKYLSHLAEESLLGKFSGSSLTQ